MSYTPKQQGSGGSGGQSSQQAKALAGITQQMQNLVHGQNALPQAAQAGLGAFANLNMTLQHQQQQQRIESIIREQQLLFSANPQFQQHFQQQMQQNAAKEPLALTRSPAELLNKMQQHHQQQANGSTSANSLASNLTSQQLQQQLQAFSQNPANLMQQIQAYQQYQMQQQNKQKMLSLNQAQQSLTSLQAQQHMQQIQQTLQQQQQKLMATHNKNLSAGNQIKSSTSSNSQASQPVQPNNNLPNKPQNKMSGSSSTQQSKLTNAPQSSKSATAPNIKNSGHPLGTPKTTTSPQLGNKPIVSPKIHVNATPPTKSSYKPPTPPAKPATITSSLPPKSTISPSSSPKPANASASTAITNVSSTEVPVKAAPILAPVPSQVALVTTPSVAPPKPCVSPAAPVAVVGSQEAEQKKAEEPKQIDEELVIKESESQIQNDKPESEEENEIEEKLESEADIEKDSKSREEKDSDTREEKDKDNKKIEENVKVDTPKIDENPESVISDADPSTATNITSESVLKTAAKSEETTENNTQKAAVKPKLYQRKNIHKSDNTAPETQVTQKEQTSKAEKRKAPVVKEVSNVEKTPKTPIMDMSDNSDERRGQRHRLKTILYQSPLPELAFIAKLSASEISVSPRNNDEKLTIFYKNEYLAVRNADGGFFLCQALQNVFKSSPRIRIRWMSEEKKDSNVYIPDFYDNTDIECVLTTVEMEKINKNSYRLPESEQGRIENILKKAIDVEKGVLPRPNVTEENPDGLDISLYKNESQIEKKTPAKKRKLNNSTKKSYSKSKSLKKKKRSKPRKERDSSDSNAEESEEETDDKEYKPSQKKNLVTQPKLRAQRSPLARARAASPITISKGLSPRSRKSVPQKTTNSGKNEENTDVSSPPTSRSDRAKRRTTETFLNKTEEEVPAKKPNLMPNQTKKAEAKTQIKTKTYKSDDELLVPMKTPPRISETWEETESKSYSKYEINDILTKKTSKKGVTSMLATKKTKTTTTTPAEYATVVSATSQPATGGRATRSRK